MCTIAYRAFIVFLSSRSASNPCQHWEFVILYNGSWQDVDSYLSSGREILHEDCGFPDSCPTQFLLVMQCL